jgi:diacylglycerol O-acyltransferase / wax synthase
MKYLSGLDATFLHIETPEMPMHVGGLNLFDLPAGYKGNFYEEVKLHVSKRLHLASVFTKKLALMPFDFANPVWIEDGDIDLDYHVRQITLPKPGTLVQLEAYVARLHSSLLDRSRPLWEFYVFDGLESGQAGFYSKIHHAALDGQGAAVMAQALLDISPVARSVPEPTQREVDPYQPEYRTTMLGVGKNDTGNRESGRWFVAPQKSRSETSVWIRATHPAECIHYQSAQF